MSILDYLRIQLFYKHVSWQKRHLKIKPKKLTFHFCLCKKWLKNQKWMRNVIGCYICIFRTSSMQKYEEMWIKQGKLELKTNLKLITSELKQKFGKICKKYKIAVNSEEELLHANSNEGTNFKEILLTWQIIYSIVRKKVHLDCLSLQYFRHFLNKKSLVFKMSFSLIHIWVLRICLPVIF